MPTSEQVGQAIERYIDTWNRGDRKGWISCWAQNTILEDPVGGPKKGGLRSIEETWDRTIGTGANWKIESVAIRICGNEAGLHLRNVNTRDKVAVDSIEFWRFDDECRIDCCRTFFTKDGVLDGYWINEGAIKG
ncbi:MAG: hypothetical protein NAOJABEB_02380 [Steroidobacteraceae bacterium]|nr:hypothetical protein [Steroidobacteraceae bacterium]